MKKGNGQTGVMLGVPIGRKPLSVLTAEALSAIRAEAPPLVFACANPHSLVTAQTDTVFYEALINAEQVVADGIGTVLLAKLIRANIGPRITGSDYFVSVMQALNNLGGARVFFFGSSEKVLNLIAARIRLDFHNITVCGCTAPPFCDWPEDENHELLERIRAAKPDVLWVGMTAPKQEKWVFVNRYKLSVPVVGSIGAVFDFYAGTYPRAPQWLCRIGMEWAYRLLSEPRRMWRRNFVSTPVFIASVIWRHVCGLGGR